MTDVLPLLQLLGGLGIVPPIGFYVAPIRDWGKFHARTKYESRQDFARLETLVFARMIQLGLRPELLPRKLLRTCVATGLEPSVLAPDGQMYFCTETPLARRNTQPTTHSKHWTDLDLDEWYSMVSSGAVPCSNCDFLPLCGGACPKEWMQEGIPCPPFVENIDQRITLLGRSKREPNRDARMQLLSSCSQ